MNRKTIVILCALAALALHSCGRQGGRKAAGTPDPTEMEAPATIADIPYFRDGNAALEPFRLCDAVLTSEEAMQSAFPESIDDFFMETTPDKEAFYFPGPDMRNEELVRRVQLRYNYVALFNRVLRSYEWFQRMSTGIDEEESPTTKKDTLEWIRRARPIVSESLVRAALPDARAQSQARELMNAYDLFDGDDGEDSPFSTAVGRYTEAMVGFPEIVSKEGTIRFEERFWDWYDKRAVVPEIDDIVRMNMSGYEGEKPTEGQLENMRRAIEAEHDIDRRTILALEYVKFDYWTGVPLLGEILESRIYTKYLLEAWISWRANAQMNHSPSSFSVIANNYYDKVRTICLDTMLRHCLESDDGNEKYLIENLVFCEIVHRMGSLMGNSSFTTKAELAYGEFIHPRLLDNDDR